MNCVIEYEGSDDNEGSVTSIYQGSRQLYNAKGEIESGWGWGFNLPTQNLFDEFEDIQMNNLPHYESYCHKSRLLKNETKQLVRQQKTQK